MQPSQAHSHAEKMLRSSQNRSREDPLWKAAEQQLLAAAILHTKEQDGNFRSLLEVIKLSPTALEHCLKNSPCSAARVEFENYKTNTTDNFRVGVQSGLIAQLQASWLNEWM